MSSIINKCKGLFTLSLLVVLCGYSSHSNAQYNYNVALHSQNAPVNYENANLSFNDFYTNLAPYGQWIDDAGYGYVFSPDVDGSFRPYYTNGHWAMTEYGNTWVSDYPWGWACFHYGRWTFDPYYGGLWIPGSIWGPAWVGWRSVDGYYGWAPFGPGYELSSSLEFSCPNDWWVFIPPQYVHTGNYYRYWNGPKNNKEHIKNSVVVTNVYESNHVKYAPGPRAKEVEEKTHKPLTTYHLANSNNLNTKSHLNVIKMYRPAEITPVSSINGQRVIPPNVVGAPQQIGKPQSLTGHNTTTPEFKGTLPKNQNEDVPGTHFIEPQKAAPAPKNHTNPYEWDVNTPVKPERRVEAQPQQAQPQQSQPMRPQPQQAQPQQQQPHPQAQPQQQPRPQSPQQAQPAPSNRVPVPAQQPRR